MDKGEMVRVHSANGGSQSPLVTVVIPTYNRAKFITRGIKSVLRQTTGRWKLLIIDDGSQDNTKAIIKPYLHDPRIRYVRQKKNRGVCYTLNHALALVDTTYFSQLDADDWYEPDTLEASLRRMEKAGTKTAVVYANDKVWKARRKGKAKYVNTKRKRQIHGKYDFITYHPMVYPRFYRTKALRKVGGWSTRVPQGGRFAEDRQILLKLAGRYSFKWINRVLYNRLKHKKNNSRIENRDKYASVTRYLYKKALKRWGNKYKPKFKWVKGRLKVGRLIKR
ncbi:glycosyltransferase family 2 protein [Paenibacillus eucommiae]|uniref:Glycosyltransferase involved in cell wall biosynthesis n=1 Tax=Paenibacillus eucommiae TaxID=1355755 RepID=A0ABS4ITT9_9BACL|nr:glycosyltransferase family 2 protein [Paenibacillus eucommiae]MBP1990980.1 glycosyltransferase involved in cell wall biosynthesis [Paenibacillus eucommiae]